ncbi:MAG TPA: hypothetical protein VGL63_00390 [Streptosporangiaceae bacterium]
MRPVPRQIENAFPGWRVWRSDEGWWYATRVMPRARGTSATVYGPGPEELTRALAEEETPWLERAPSVSA